MLIEGGGSKHNKYNHYGFGRVDFFTNLIDVPKELYGKQRIEYLVDKYGLKKPVECQLRQILGDIDSDYEDLVKNIKKISTVIKCNGCPIYPLDDPEWIGDDDKKILTALEKYYVDIAKILSNYPQ
jgi:hypothetical protein